MKLEEGMYVRTKYGIARFIHNLVTKVTIYRVIDKKIVYDNVEYCKDCLLDNEIIKASHNIVDLIEVGDYVNGYPVYETIEYPDNTRAIVIADDNKSIIWEESSQYIKSIVTKEQFESMKYEVK